MSDVQDAEKLSQLRHLAVPVFIWFRGQKSAIGPAQVSWQQKTLKTLPALPPLLDDGFFTPAPDQDPA